MSAETAAILDEAANVIRRNGLHAGWYYDEDSGKPPAESPVDVYGAINIVATGDPIGSESPHNGTAEAFAARSALRRQIGTPSASTWNDAPDRTAEDVIAALEAAARVEREAAS